MNNDRAIAFWNQYLAGLGPDDPAHSAPFPDIWGFGDSPELAEELGQLVYQGIKTATCSSVWEREFDKDPQPVIGGYSIVLDGAGGPLCIIQTIEATVRLYDEVDAQFAFEEGEGDRSLETWRQGHWSFFSRTLTRIGRTADQKMPLLCERFRTVYKR